MTHDDDFDWKAAYLDLKLWIAVRDEAYSDATAKWIIQALKPGARFNDEREVVVELTVEHDGIKDRQEFSLADAVQELRRDVTNYGTLFKSGCAAGIGGR